MRIAGHAVADQLGMDLRAALLRVLVLLEHDDAGALAHAETVTVAIPRPRSLFGRLVDVRRAPPRRGEALAPEPARRPLPPPRHPPTPTHPGPHPPPTPPPAPPAAPP